MFKRKGGDGDEPSAKNVKVDPIPRTLPSQSITIPLVQRTWEEIAPGELYYLPLCQTPRYMLDEAMLNQLGKFKELWHTMEIHKPQVRITNLTMLQDDLRVQTNTPTDATAFTQVIYLVSYKPSAQKQYFKLGTLVDKNTEQQSKDLVYKLKPPRSDSGIPSQLVKMSGFEDFESLTIKPAKANATAGFSSGVPPKEVLGILLDPYMAPNSGSPLSQVSGNMNPANDNFIENTYTLTMARNQDKICFHKYGDTITFDIETNLDGLQLANHPSNDFTRDAEILVPVEDNKKIYHYLTEFVWPSRNRPYFYRGNYYDTNTSPITQGKSSFKPLNHYFLCMPPIKKPNGALLGQRCSIMLEQSFSVTFHFNLGTFQESEADDALQVHQDDQVILRRNVYPIPDVEDLKDSIFCPRTTNDECELSTTTTGQAADKLCVKNSFHDLTEFFETRLAVPGSKDWDAFTTFSNSEEKPVDAVDMTAIFQDTTSITLPYVDDPPYAPLKQAWVAAMNGDGKLRLWWGGRVAPTFSYQGLRYYIYISTESKIITNSLVLKMSATGTFRNYIIIDIKTMLDALFFPYVQNVCKPKFHAPIDSSATAFFV
nr:MAG: major capsid protein [Army ant associated bidensovirus 3]